jgi:hypothetical protein
VWPSGLASDRRRSYRVEWRGHKSIESRYRLIAGDEGLPKEANQGPIENRSLDMSD